MLNKYFNITALFFTIFFSSCGLFDEDTEYQTYQITIDTLTLPEYTAVNDTIYAWIKGTAGPNGCYKFSHYENSQNSLDAQIKVWGVQVKTDICPQSINYINDFIKYVPLRTGYFKVKVLNPGNQFLLDSVLVY